MTPRIITVCAPPPIPCRQFDWCAYDDNLGEDCSPYGWGRTEQEAIADFLERLEEQDD